MISTGDLRKGLTIELDGQLFTIIDWQHIKMGRGGAIVRMKLRNLRNGSTIERTFDASERFRRVYLDRRTVQYQYNDGDQYYFMDTQTFDQIMLTADQLGDARGYLTDGLTLDLIEYEGKPVTVDLKVTYTEPGFKGDTATGGSKPATLETGIVVQVPLFVNTGDVIRVRTDTGTYVERVG
jgi:elongation factor P